MWLYTKKNVSPSREHHLYSETYCKQTRRHIFNIIVLITSVLNIIFMSIFRRVFFLLLYYTASCVLQCIWDNTLSNITCFTSIFPFTEIFKNHVCPIVQYTHTRALNGKEIAWCYMDFLLFNVVLFASPLRIRYTYILLCIHLYRSVCVYIYNIVLRVKKKSKKKITCILFFFLRKPIMPLTEFSGNVNLLANDLAIAIQAVCSYLCVYTPKSRVFL